MIVSVLDADECKTLASNRLLFNRAQLISPSPVAPVLLRVAGFDTLTIRAGSPSGGCAWLHCYQGLDTYKMNWIDRYPIILLVYHSSCSLQHTLHALYRQLSLASCPLNVFGTLLTPPRFVLSPTILQCLFTPSRTRSDQSFSVSSS